MQDKAPDNVAMAKIIELTGGNLELLHEIKADHDGLVAKNRTEEYSKDAKSALDDTISVATYIDEKRQDLAKKLWDGTITEDEIEMLHPEYFSFQESLAQKALQELDANVRAEKLHQVTMIYQINDKSEFVRAYLHDGKKFNHDNEQDEKIINILDQSFHSWLLKNKMVSVEGVLYKQAGSKGGKPTQKADPSVVSALLEDAQKGLAKKQAASFNLEVKAYQPKAPSVDVESASPQTAVKGAG